MKERQAAQQRLARRFIGSLALALALHALVAWLLLRHGIVFVQPEPPKQQAIRVELVEPPPQPPPVRPPPPVQPDRLRVDRQPAPPVRPAPPLPTPPSGQGGRSETPGTAPQIATPAPPAPGSSPPGEALPPSTNPKDVRIYDPKAFAKQIDKWKQSGGAGNGTGAGDGTSPGSGSGDDNSPAAEHARVTGRMQGAIADAQAQNRVSAGLVDPYFGEIKNGMKDEWLPTAGQMGGADGDGLIAGLKNLAQGWHSAGKQYASTGSPYPEGETANGTAPTRDATRPPGGTSGFDGADFAARWNAGEFAFSGGLVVVQLTQDPDGKPLKVQVLKSSGFKEFDRTATEAIKKVAAAREAPKHGYGLGGPNIRSVWKLEARMVPQTCSFVPDPTGMTGGAGFYPTSLACGGTFDIANGKVTAEVNQPLKTRIITKVDLVAIYGGEINPQAMPH